MSKQDEINQYQLDLHFGLVGVVNALIHTLLQREAIDVEGLRLSLQALPLVLNCNADQQSVFAQVLRGLEEPRWRPQVIEGGLSSNPPLEDGQ